MLTLLVKQVLTGVRHHVVIPFCLDFCCVAIHKLLELNSLGDDSEYSNVKYAIGWGDRDSSHAPFPGLFTPAVSVELRQGIVSRRK